jgi:hypothetical protein
MFWKLAAMSNKRLEEVALRNTSGNLVTWAKKATAADRRAVLTSPLNAIKVSHPDGG